MLLHSHTPLKELNKFLHQHHIISLDDAVVQMSIPGEGNMNVVYRVETLQKKSLILKQSRPFVQRYQSIPAPLERISVEHAFYTAISQHEVSNALPHVIGFFSDHNLLILEDLGEGSDLTNLYKKRSFSPTQLEQTVKIARGIHQSTAPEDYPDNLKLLQLNHQHIFELPFLEDNGFDLDSVQVGLTQLAQPIKTNKKLVHTIQELGTHYLAGGTTLVHGDYYPGSWLERQEVVYALDPEFSHLGCAEFDLGVLTAHSALISHQDTTLKEILGLYNSQINSALVKQYAGVEILRRLIGLAQLPLERTLKEKAELLDLASSWLID